MKSSLVALTALGFSFILVSSAGAELATPVSPCSGCEMLGEYQQDFEKLHLARDSGGEPSIVTIEGRLTSHLYRRPAELTQVQLAEGYEAQLRAAGFTILLTYSPDDGKVPALTTRLYPEMGERRYERDGRSLGSDPRMIAPFGTFYLSATKTAPGGDTHVAIVLGSKRNLHVVDVLETGVFDEDEVTLDLSALRASMTSSGKHALREIRFASNSPTLRGESRAAIRALAEYLQENPDLHYYVVGHEDDRGELSRSVGLSESRARAVVEALVSTHGIAKGRVLARGVGPLAPLGSNATEEGRRLNRRIELVLRTSR
ncbi:MAG: OmpA family protein [Acidobacteriota bacterium]